MFIYYTIVYTQNNTGQKCFKLSTYIYSPYTSCNRSGMMNTNEFVACSGNVKIWLLLIDKKRIGNPNIFYEFWSNGKCFNARSLFICQPWICPKLSKVEIQRKVLEVYKIVWVCFNLYYITIMYMNITLCLNILIQ